MPTAGLPPAGRRICFLPLNAPAGDRPRRVLQAKVTRKATTTASIPPWPLAGEKPMPQPTTAPPTMAVPQQPWW
eukprot:5264275-Amphidinium_carterae.1